MGTLIDVLKRIIDIPKGIPEIIRSEGDSIAKVIDSASDCVVKISIALTIKYLCKAINDSHTALKVIDILVRLLAGDTDIRKRQITIQEKGSSEPEPEDPDSEEL